MNKLWLTIRRPLIFSAIGAVAGLIYHLVIGCTAGNCVITSNIISSMLYPGFIGMWFGMVSKGGCCCGGGSCDITPKNNKD